MSNEEITKALGLCFNINDNAGLNCGECPYKERTECSLNLYSDTIDLINRQQAEIDRLTDRNKRLGEGVGWLLNNENGIELIRAEAIKEFAEKVENKLGVPFMVNNQVVGIVLDETIKEMVGADND